MQLRQAEQALADARLVGDVKIAAFFEGGNKKGRQAKLTEYAKVVRDWRSQSMAESTPQLQNAPMPQPNHPLSTIANIIRHAEKPITPFNWELEFPEVFDRENPGFNAIVGNPPFLGGVKISKSYSPEYLHFLYSCTPEAGGQCDLAAFFFRKAFTLIRKMGTFGLIGTNTIAQGDTRDSGLTWICENNGSIYNAKKRVKWPGIAAVLVSTVHVIKGEIENKYLDDKKVYAISAFLLHSSQHSPPKRLLNSRGKLSFLGSMVGGVGFIFEENNNQVTSLNEMREIVRQNPENLERIFPFLGGEEVNSHPEHKNRRFIIDFGDMSEEDARKWPDLMSIVETKVKPCRDTVNRKSHRKRWWQYGDKRTELYQKARKLDKVLACSRHSPHLSFAFLPSQVVFSEALVVLTLDALSEFCVLQSRPHEIWARLFGSSIKDDLRYTPSDCFETFPFPENWEIDRTLEDIGQTYYTYRADLMVRNAGPHRHLQPLPRPPRTPPRPPQTPRSPRPNGPRRPQCLRLARHSRLVHYPHRGGFTNDFAQRTRCGG